MTVEVVHGARRGQGNVGVRGAASVVHVTGDLDEEQRERLHRIGDRCPVQRMLEGGLRVESALEAG